MTPAQVSLWTEERSVAYFLFGFMALLLERVPVVGLVFSISNRIGAALWAHDLEKRQHRFQRGELDLVDAGAPSLPKEGAPGSYGHPDRADVALPGDILAPPTADMVR